MSTTLICTLGKLENYDSDCSYTFQGHDLGNAYVPATVLARHFRPERIVLLCPGETQETGTWFADELAPHGLPVPQLRTLPIPHAEADIPAVLHALADVLNEEVREGTDIHLDLSLGLRFITILGLLTTDLLAGTAGTSIARLTCINMEGARKTGAAEVLDVTSYLHLGRLRSAVEALEQRGDIETLARTIAAAFPGSLNGGEVDEAAELQRRLGMLRVGQATSKSGGRKLIRRLIQLIEERAAALPVLTTISRRVREHLSPLDPGDASSKSPAAIASLARWYADHGMPVHAILLIDEAVDQFKVDQSLGDARFHFANLRQRTNDIRNSIAHADWTEGTSATLVSESVIAEAVDAFSAAARVR